MRDDTPRPDAETHLEGPNGCRPSQADSREVGHTGRAAGVSGGHADRQTCGCWACREERSESLMVMVICPDCGNKRCPRAADHRNACTNSNLPGQPGSAYEFGSGAASARRFAAPSAPTAPKDPTR